MGKISERNPKTDRNLWVGLSIAVLCLIAVGLFLQFKLQYVAETNTRRIHIRRIIVDVKSLKSTIIDAQAGHLGFLFTGNKRYLQPYKDSLVLIEDKFNELKENLRDQPAQLQKLITVEDISEKLLGDLKLAADLKRGGEDVKALALGTAPINQVRMERLREIFEEIEIFQESQLGLLTAPSFYTIQEAKYLNIAGSLFAVVVVGVLGALLVRNRRLHELNSFIATNSSLEKKQNIFLEVIRIQNELVSSTLDAPVILDKVVHLSMELTKSEGATIEELELDSGDLVYRYAAGAARSFLGMRVNTRNSFSGLCLKEQKPLLCRDSETDDRVDREACRRVGLRSMIVTPLYYGDKLLGVLKNYSDQPDYYSEEVFNGFVLVSSMLSSALGHAKEFDEANKLIKELEITRKDSVLSRGRSEASF